MPVNYVVVCYSFVVFMLMSLSSCVTGAETSASVTEADFRRYWCDVEARLSYE